MIWAYVYPLFVTFLCAALFAGCVSCYFLSGKRHMLYLSAWFFLFFLSEFCRILFDLLSVDLATWIVDGCILLGSSAVTVCYTLIAYDQVGKRLNRFDKLFFLGVAVALLVLYAVRYPYYDGVYVLPFFWATYKLFHVYRRDTRTRVMFYFYLLITCLQTIHRVFYPMISGNNMPMLHLSVISELMFYLTIAGGVLDLCYTIRNRECLGATTAAAVVPEPSESRVQASDEFIEQIAEQYALSPREKCVFTLLVQGKSNQEISQQLYISEGTVKVHLHNIYRKTNLGGRTKLLSFLSDYILTHSQ